MDRRNLAKGFIRNSFSLWRTLLSSLSKRTNYDLLAWIYRGLNKQTVKDRNPIPLISEMLRTLSTGKIFTTLDLRGAIIYFELRRVTIKNGFYYEIRTIRISGNAFRFG
ncbi:hypothetical protein BASA83_000585 [Batrachochytrium salamandrivorans]|nr:hypothetical protein BASA83_000585 [Batrachochytrium salamandrivorans]